MSLKSNLIAALAAVAALAACVHVPQADPAVQVALQDIAASAGGFFAGLHGKTAPDCGFDANAGSYASLNAKAAALAQRVAAGPPDPPLQQAVAALGQTIAGSEQAHRLASSNAADANGICLAPAVIDLNADAVARAAAAVIALERQRGSL